MVGLLDCDSLKQIFFYFLQIVEKGTVNVNDNNIIENTNQFFQQGKL